MAKLYGKAADVGAEIVERFKNPASLPAPLAQVFIRRRDQSPCRKWSWGNQMVVAMHGYSEARGFRQWQEVGRHVKKGERAIYILAPCVKKFETESDDGTTEEHLAVHGFRSVAVFGLEQTDGAPLPVDEEAIAWLAGLPLREVAESWGIEIQTCDGAEGGRLGFYSCAGDRIGLGVRNLDVFGHELVHAADARIIGGLKPGQHVDREVVAQLGAAILLTLRDAGRGGPWPHVGVCRKLRPQDGQSDRRCLPGIAQPDVPGRRLDPFDCRDAVPDDSVLHDRTRSGIVCFPEGRSVSRPKQPTNRVARRD